MNSNYQNSVNNTGLCKQLLLETINNLFQKSHLTMDGFLTHEIVKLSMIISG
jgi:hypothetical protein